MERVMKEVAMGRTSASAGQKMFATGRELLGIIGEL